MNDGVFLLYRIDREELSVLTCCMVWLVHQLKGESLNVITSKTTLR